MSLPHWLELFWVVTYLIYCFLKCLSFPKSSPLGNLILPIPSEHWSCGQDGGLLDMWTRFLSTVWPTKLKKHDNGRPAGNHLYTNNQPTNNYHLWLCYQDKTTPTSESRQLAEKNDSVCRCSMKQWGTKSYLLFFLLERTDVADLQWDKSIQSWAETPALKHLVNPPESPWWPTLRNLKALSDEHRPNVSNDTSFLLLLLLSILCNDLLQNGSFQQRTWIRCCCI